MSSERLKKLSDEELALIDAGKVEQLSDEALTNYLEAENEMGVADAGKQDGILEKFEEKADALKERGWNNLSSSERLELMALKFPDKFLSVGLGVVKGAPAMTMRAAAPAIGQKLGQLTRIPGVDRIGGFAGGVLGELGADLYEGSEITTGKLMGAGVSGAIRRRNTPEAAPSQLTGNTYYRRLPGAVAEGGRQGVENAAIDVAETAIDTGELKAPSAKAFTAGTVGGMVQGVTDTGSRARDKRVARADEAPAYETTAAAYDAGAGRAKGAAFPIIPRKAVPTDFERAVNSAVRRDIGMPETSRLTTGALDVHLNRLYEPYRQAARISPEAENLLNAVTESRAESRRLHKAYRASQGNRPDLLEEADGYDDLARGFETDLINTVRAAGRDNLAEQIITNRRLAAKTHIAMRANNSARGVVEADEYGRVSRKNPRLLDGDAKLIADTYNARQQQEFHLGTMLSRPVMLAEKGAGALERTRFGQMLSRNTPSWHEYPDLKSAASSFLINREGREEPLPIKPKSPKERVERAVSEAVKKYIGLSK